MDSNQPISSHHPTHHQHHLDIPLNDSKKRSNNHNPVDDCRNNILFIIPHLFSRRFRLVIIIHRYQWSMNWINRILNNKIIYQVCCSICSRKNILSETFFNKVHGTGGIDASSSPSPQSTYSAQSSPSESRTSPNAALKQQQQQSATNSSNKFSINSNSRTSLTSPSSHLTSHHNDLTAGTGGATNRLNGKLNFSFSWKSRS